MILISILGDFHSSILPIFYNFKDDITKHILVYDISKRDKEKAKEVQKGLEVFKKKYNHIYKLDKYMVEEDFMESLVKCAKDIKKLSNKYSDIYINTTDGFSTLTTVLNHKLFKYGVNFISYDMFDNEYNILNISELINKQKIKNNLNIADHFILKGYDIEQKKFKDFAHKYENNISTIFEKHSQKFDEYLKLKPKTNTKVRALPDGKIKNLFIHMGLEHLNAKDSFMMGSLYEYYIYNLIKGLDYDDIEVGMVVKREYGNSSVVNEFDILIMKNNHLHMIECKYRNYNNGTQSKPDQLVYKYIALSEIIDEDGKMIMVVKNELHKDSEKPYEENLANYEKRGRLNNIFFKGAVHKKPALFSMHVKNIFNL